MALRHDVLGKQALERASQGLVARGQGDLFREARNIALGSRQCYAVEPMPPRRNVKRQAPRNKGNNFRMHQRKDWSA